MGDGSNTCAGEREAKIFVYLKPFWAFIVCSVNNFFLVLHRDWFNLNPTDVNSVFRFHSVPFDLYPAFLSLGDILHSFFRSFLKIFY